MPKTEPPPSAEPVATGDRRDEAHLAPDADQLVRAEFLFSPTRAPPPDEHTGRVDEGLQVADQPPVEDLKVAPESPSVWDARPPDQGPATAPPAPGAIRRRLAGTEDFEDS